jgi:diguanylate cyclase (GGDEF)-like protein/PAS domain S-box-containing protein
VSINAPEPEPHQQIETELFSVGADAYVRDVNDAFAALLGLTAPEVSGRSLLELIHPDDIGGVVTGLAELHDGAEMVLLESRFMQRDGRWLHLQFVARAVPGTDAWRVSGRDVTEFHRLQTERLDLRTQLGLAVGQSTAAMWELDIGSGLLTWEPQAADIFGVDPDGLPDSASEFAAVIHPEDAPSLLAALDALISTGATQVALRTGSEQDPRHVSFRGKVLDRDWRGRAARAVGLLLDVSTEKAMEQQMLRMVMSDALTGAPNRRAFDQALRTEWRRCSRALEPLSVLMIDIDDFKRFNDSFGHLVGDDALCVVARALTAAVNRAGDTVARFGGEEFAVVLPDTDSTGAAVVADRMVHAIRAVTLRQADRPLSISVGSASWNPDGTITKPAVLLARADQALYAAKAEGKDRSVAYEHSIAARDAFIAAMTDGLARDEFELHYQPVIALGDDQVVGFEALMRWNRPGHGMVRPDDFIPAAETTDLICDLGRWALREATLQLASWSRAGIDSERTLRMAVNASGRHVNTAAIVTDVEAALAESGIAPQRLEVEVTETALVDNALADLHLAAIRALGVRVAIDDFGTGYTSVGQLPHLPVDTLKIDRSFVASTNPRQRSLVTLMIAAAHAFDLDVVAEGIEDIETMQFLRTLNCDTAQGYLMGRPMPAEQIPTWLTDWQTAHLPKLKALGV